MLASTAMLASSAGIMSTIDVTGRKRGDPTLNNGYLAAVSNLPLSRANCLEHTIAKIRFTKTPYTQLRNRCYYSSKLWTCLKTCDVCSGCDYDGWTESYGMPLGFTGIGSSECGAEPPTLTLRSCTTFLVFQFGEGHHSKIGGPGTTRLCQTPRAASWTHGFHSSSVLSRKE